MFRFPVVVTEDSQLDDLFYPPFVLLLFQFELSFTLLCLIFFFYKILLITTVFICTPIMFFVAYVVPRFRPPRLLIVVSTAQNIRRYMPADVAFRAIYRGDQL